MDVNAPAYPDDDAAFALFQAYFDDAALLRVKSAARCAVCRTPPAPTRLGDTAACDAWLVEASGRMGHAWSAERDEPELLAVPALAEIDDVERRRRIADSQLAAIVGIPTALLLPIAAELTEDEAAFVTSELVLAACAVCRDSPHAEHETSRTVVERYLLERFAGNRTAFNDSGAARTIAPILALLDRAAGSATG